MFIMEVFDTTVLYSLVMLQPTYSTYRIISKSLKFYDAIPGCYFHKLLLLKNAEKK